MMCRYFSGRRILSPVDQLTLEFAGTYRHYHACLMRTLRIGKPPARQVALHQAASDAILACESALRAGRTVADVFDAHATTLDRAGLRPIVYQDTDGYLGPFPQKERLLGPSARMACSMTSSFELRVHSPCTSSSTR